MRKYYAGIGSRTTPLEIQEHMSKIAGILSQLGYTLRSGGADGADRAFEQGCGFDGCKEIYLPWALFNNNTSRLFGVTTDALNLATKYHPAWSKLSQAAQKLMARNCYQILGQDLKTPVDFVVCYTSDGKASGGTGQAMRLARAYNIPIFNLHDVMAIVALQKLLTSKK